MYSGFTISNTYLNIKYIHFRISFMGLSIKTELTLCFIISHVFWIPGCFPHWLEWEEQEISVRLFILLREKNTKYFITSMSYISLAASIILSSTQWDTSGWLILTQPVFALNTIVFLNGFFLIWGFPIKLLANKAFLCQLWLRALPKCRFQLLNSHV